MEQNLRVRGNHVVAVKVTGEIDIDCAAELRQEIERITEPPVLHLLIDIDEVKHLDSYSLGTFVALRQRMKSRKGSVGLVCSKPSLRRLFAMTNLDKIFSFHESDREFAAEHGGECVEDDRPAAGPPAASP